MREAQKAINCTKNDNRGISLVELLVSVAILAIIVAPLLRAFVIASQTNQKAKDRQRATAVAQNVMEELVAMDVETLALSIDKNASFPGASDVKELLVSSAADGTVSVSRTPDPDADEASVDASGSFVGQSGNVYGSKSYDVLITLNGSENASDAVKLHNYGIRNAGDTASDVSYASVSRLDGNRDAICAEKERPSVVLNSHASEFGTDSQDAVNRTITINITGPVGKRIVSAKYSYVLASDTSKAYETAETYYQEESTGQLLSNVYLMYYPWYASKDGACKDTIVVNNESGAAVTVNLVKQIISDGYKSGSYYTDKGNENKYTVTVNAKAGDGTSDPNITFKSNLLTNIAVDGVIDTQTTITNTDFIKLLRNGSEVSNTPLLEGLVTYATDKRLYDLTVSVYPAGAFDSDFKDMESAMALTGGIMR